MKVLAATYSWRGDAIVVLDEVDGRARLTSVDFRSGVATHLGDWPRHGLVWDKAWLSLDTDGGVLLTTSSHGNRHYVVTKLLIERNSSPTLEGTRKWNAELLLPPIVESTGGYTFVEREKENKPKKNNPPPPARHLLEFRNDLNLHPACWEDLAAQL